MRGIEERLGEGSRILLVIMDEGEDKEEIMDRKEEIWERWRMSVEKDLSREERKLRWRIKEKARTERRGR